VGFWDATKAIRLSSSSRASSNSTADRSSDRALRSPSTAGYAANSDLAGSLVVPEDVQRTEISPVDCDLEQEVAPQEAGERAGRVSMRLRTDGGEASVSTVSSSGPPTDRTTSTDMGTRIPCVTLL
jgi:hypothetical protein